MKTNMCWMIIILITTIAACKKNSTEEQTKNYIIKGDTIIIEQNSNLQGRLKTISVEEELFAKEITASATVQANPNQLAYVNLPFSGRITKSYIKLGQKVIENAPLFEVMSSDFIASQKEFFKAQSERELALKDLKRKEDLLKNGVGSQKELEEANNAFKIANKEYENAYASLKIFHPHPEQMIVGQPLIVRSPIAGEIVENIVILGEFFNNDDKHIVTVANFSQVWITANVKEKDIRFIKENENMTFKVMALPERTFVAKVFHIDNMIDEETRSFQVISLCDNKDRALKAGMYADVIFKNETSPQIIIPEKALLQDEKNSYVLVQLAPSVFAKKVVEVEVTKDNKAVITSGLKKGDILISEGGYYLK